MANRLRTTGLIGTLAAVGPGPLLDVRYLAFLLNVPSVGHIFRVNDPQEILSSGAALVIVPRGTALAARLRADRRFASADKQLFGCTEADENAVEIFLTKPLPATDTCPGSGSGH